MYQLKITIDDITPAIWRTIQLPESYSLNKLHHIIQITLGWTNSHLYMFGHYENKFGDPMMTNANIRRKEPMRELESLPKC